MASALYSAGAAHPRWSAAAHPGSPAGSRPSSLEAAAPTSPAAVSALGGVGAPQALLAVSGPACAAAAVAAAAPALAPRARLKRPPDLEPATAVAPPSGCAGAGSCLTAGPGAKLGAKPERTSSLSARRVSFEAAQAAQHRSASCCSSASMPGGHAWRRLSGGSGGARRFSSLEARPGRRPAPCVCAKG